MATLCLPGCCLSSDSASRRSQARLSPRLRWRVRLSSLRVNPDGRADGFQSAPFVASDEVGGNIELIVEAVLLATAALFLLLETAYAHARKVVLQVLGKPPRWSCDRRSVLPSMAMCSCSPSANWSVAKDFTHASKHS